MNSLIAYADDSDDDDDENEQSNKREESNDGATEGRVTGGSVAPPPPPTASSSVGRTDAVSPEKPTQQHQSKRKLIGSRLRKDSDLSLSATRPASFVLPVDAAKLTAAVEATENEARIASGNQSSSAAAAAAAAQDQAIRKKPKGGLFSYLPPPKAAGGSSSSVAARSRDEAAAGDAESKDADVQQAAALYGDDRFAAIVADAQAAAPDQPSTTGSNQPSSPRSQEQLLLHEPAAAASSSSSSSSSAKSGGSKKRKIRSLHELNQRREQMLVASTGAATDYQYANPFEANADASATAATAPITAGHSYITSGVTQNGPTGAPPGAVYAAPVYDPNAVQQVDEDQALAGLNLPPSFYRERERQARVDMAMTGQRTKALLDSNSVTAAAARAGGGFLEVNMGNLIQTTSEEAAKAPKTAAELGFVKVSDQRKAARLTYLAKQAQAFAPELEDRNRRLGRSKKGAAAKYGW